MFEIETRSLGVLERGIDSAARTATFVAATASGSRIVLSGLDLKRYRKNPVVLNSHNLLTLDGIVGRAEEVKVERGQLLATVLFAPTSPGEQVWSLVRDGFLPGFAMGLISRKVQDLREGESIGEICGPGRVVVQAELYELSIMSLAADPDALLQRDLNEPDAGTRSAELSFEEIRCRTIRALTPRSLVELGECCITEGLSVEAARQELLAAHTSRTAGAAARNVLAVCLNEISDELWARSLCAPVM